MVNRCDLRFQRRHRLHRRSDFARVFQRKRSAADDTLVVYVCENDLGHARLGLIVSRRLGSAVARNRCKRILREAFRHQRKNLPAVDLIVLPRQAALCRLDRAQRSLVRLVRRLSRRPKTTQ